MAPTHHHHPTPTLIRWGAVVAGAFIGVALMVLLTSLFVALGSEAGAIARNLHWFGLISAIVALFVAGLLAGGLSGVRGVGSGLLHGITTWGLILVVAMAFPFPQAFGLLEVFTTPVPELAAGPLWATFLSLAGGAIVAAIGGLIGGMLTRPAVMPGHERVMDRPYEADRPYEPERAYEAERPYAADRPYPAGQEYEAERSYGAGRGYEAERAGRPAPGAGYEEPTAREVREEPTRGQRRR